MIMQQLGCSLRVLEKFWLKRWGASTGFLCGLFGKNTGDVDHFIFKICQLRRNDVGKIIATARQY